MAAFMDSVHACLQNIRKEECVSKRISLFKTLYDILKELNTEQNKTVFNDHTQLYHDLMTLLTNSGLVDKSFEIELHGDYKESDFADLTKIAEWCLSSLEILLPFLQYFESEDKIYKSVILSVLLLSASHSSNYPWSSEICVAKTKNVLSSLLNITHFENIELLLQGTKQNENLISLAFSYIKPHLTKNNWNKNPSYRYIFKWFLLYIKFPYLTNYLSDVLPPPLLFVDDHVVENKVLGLECLSHIIENVPPTELKLNGKADVIYDALKHLLYTAEIPVINTLHPCLLKFLSGQERNPKNRIVDFKPNRYDEVFKHLLWSMEHEQKIIFRRAYSALVQDYIYAMGITICYHMKQTLRILLEYIIIYDGPEEISRRNALQSLKILISVAWPRMAYHWEEIMKSILICIYEVEKEAISIEVKSSLLNEARNCVLYMKRACPEKFEMFLEEMPTDPDLPAINMIKSLQDLK